MIMYYQTRDKARTHKGSKGKVIDCRNNPSINGSKWGVKTK